MKKETTQPTHKKTFSRAAAALRRRELEQLTVVNLGPNFWGYGNGNYAIYDLAYDDVPELRLHRRDVLVVREVAAAGRNAVVAVSHECDGEEANYLCLWLKGGERVVTVRDVLEGCERVLLREEITYIGVAVGVIRREWRNVPRPPVHVFKGGA